ncbi:MAG: hypothetical protein ACI8R9_002740 [Paraglaciecola sp.]|jgi:hypothetical protein
MLFMLFMLLAMFFISGFSSTTISIKRTAVQPTGGKATRQFAHKFSAIAKKK